MLTTRAAALAPLRRCRLQSRRECAALLRPGGPSAIAPPC